MTSNIAPLSTIRTLLHLRDTERVLALDCEGLLETATAHPTACVTYRGFDELDAAMLVGPGLVIMPLFAGDTDATAMIERLVALGYQGKVAVLAPTLPNPRLVERELRGMGLRVTVISP